MPVLRGERFEGRLIIDDSNFQEVLPDRLEKNLGIDAFRGRNPRDFSTHPLGGLKGFKTIPRKLIPRSEWSARIKDNEARGMTNRERIKRKNWRCKNQKRTNFCWGNGAVTAFELNRLTQGFDHVYLSSASVCCRITNFQNIGGWGHDAMVHMVEKGVTPEVLDGKTIWPNAVISQSLDTAEARALALRFRVLEWWDLTPRIFAELATCLLDQGPCCAGYNWWGHEICCLDLVEIAPNDFGVLIVNSWDFDWPEPGANGQQVLRESKATPDDAQCPLVALAA